MKKVIRCAIAGLGRIAWDFHIPQIKTRPEFELVAVMDPIEERLLEAKSKFGVVNLFKDYSAMLAQGNIDLVVIASPSIYHKQQAIEALERGYNVFCDKPLALNLNDAKEIFAAAHRLKKKVMTYQQHRLNGETLAARSIIDSGKLGNIYLIERHLANFVRRNDWQAFKCNGGGMLFNYGSHYIDQLYYLLGEYSAKVRCSLLKIASLGDAEDVVKAQITTNRGTLLEIDINQAVAIGLPEWRICGSRGTAVFHGSHWQLRYFNRQMLSELKADTGMAAANRKYPAESIPWINETLPALEGRSDSYYRYCYQYFAENEPPFVSEPEILELIKTLDECRKDARLKTMEKIHVYA